MTAMLATSARHLSVLRAGNTVYPEAAMSLLSRSCVSFGAVLGREDGHEKHDALFFTALLIHYLTWCNLDFAEGRPAADHRHGLDLGGDQLFLLGSGVRVFLSRAREQGSGSVFATVSSISRCGALDKIVEDQRMGCDGVVEAFMERYDEIVDRRSQKNTSTSGPTASTMRGELLDRPFAEREAYRGIAARLSVIVALWKHRDRNSSPPQRSDLERYVLSFPLFCFGTFLDMIASGDSGAVLVLYHFYRTSSLLLGAEVPWWAARRLKVMESLLAKYLERRGVQLLAEVS